MDWSCLFFISNQTENQAINLYGFTGLQNYTRILFSREVMLVYWFTGIQLVLKHRHWFTGLQVHLVLCSWNNDTGLQVYWFSGSPGFMFMYGVHSTLLTLLQVHLKICPGSSTLLLLVYRYTSIQLHLVLKQSYIIVWKYL